MAFAFDLLFITINLIKFFQNSAWLLQTVGKVSFIKLVVNKRAYIVYWATNGKAMIVLKFCIFSFLRKLINI